METMPAFIASTVFVGVIILIMTETLHLTIAGFLGALIIIFCHIITLQEAANYISQSYATIALFFGVMVLVRAFEPTKVFEYIATKMVISAQGDGKKLLLGIVAMTATYLCCFTECNYHNVTCTFNPTNGSRNRR
jgi:Na+/H+ antiporter NhaD/arsenite permease-like protein